MKSRRVALLAASLGSAAPRRRVALSLATLFAASALAATAHAVELPKLDDRPLRLDITEVSIFSQRFHARTTEGELLQDQGYGAWVNRLNLALNYDQRWIVGTRLDSALYWKRPVDEAGLDDTQKRDLEKDATSRFRNRIYPAKVWVTYAAPGVEVTAGDSYVQFGRGLVLSMRKIDDLGLDTTLRGGKIAIQKDPIGLTLIAGFANPSRIDDPSGRSLFLPEALKTDTRGAQPIFGSDRLIGAEVQAGRGTPVILSTHAVRLTRCAPFQYDDHNRVIDSGLSSEVGSCADSDNEYWRAGLDGAGSQIRQAGEVWNVGQSIEIPRLGNFGNLYIGGALQQRRHETYVADGDRHPDGNALYGTYSGNIGPVTNTVEVRSYRNFYSLMASIPGGVNEFSSVVYSLPPTTESILQDSSFGFFNVCVNGGRVRSDVRISEPLLVYGQALYARTQTEISGGDCDQFGRTTTTKDPKETTTNVWDGVVGFQYQWDSSRSYLFASLGRRDDRKVNGDFYYDEWSANYTLSQWLGGAYSVELLGRHRVRHEDNTNMRGPDDAKEPKPWVEGENYAALKIAPKWVVSQGFEYKSQIGQPTYYVNGSALFRFTSDSNVRVFVGQQRGGLRCVSGVCRIVPPYEGARVELTLRF